MSRFSTVVVGLLALVGTTPDLCLARGFGGGGGGGGGGGRAGGGGGGRPAARPSMGHLGSGSHSGPRPSASRPAVSRPSTSRPSAASRPSNSIARPSGGMKPSISRPAVGGDFPSTRPSLPSSGGSGQLANRPSGSMPSLSTRPSNRPFVSGGQRPDFGDRPQVGGGTDFGNMRPGGTGPSAGDLGNFLGIQQPLRPAPLPGVTPGRPGAGDIAARPSPGPGGGINRPAGDNRPGIINRPADGSRPGGGSGQPRPGGGGNRPDRPWKPGDRPNIGHNNNIHNRPSWVHIGNNTINNINANWGNAINKRPGMNNWLNNHPDRANHWNNWANNVHDHWHGGDRWFDRDWWDHHWHGGAGWHYWHGFHNRP